MKKKHVFIHGKFNIIHPGHLNLFKSSKDLGDKLTVGIYSDRLNIEGIYLKEKLRLDALKQIKIIDKVVIIKKSLKKTIQEIKPDIILKGSEFKNKYNEEVSYSRELKFQLLFSNYSASLSDMINGKQKLSNSAFSYKYLKSFLKRRNLNKNYLNKVIKKISKLKALIIGDVIIDEYIELQLVGLSREDSNIVYSPIKHSKKYIGGAGIVSLHAKSLGCDTEIVSVLGEDERKKFILNNLKKNKIKNKIFVNQNINTLLKQRYQHKNKSIFRLSYLNDNIQNLEITNSLIKHLKYSIKKKDLILISDFNYGSINDEVYNTIRQLSSQFKIPLIVDSQSSSQIGTYNRYISPDIITPTEHEARLTTHDSVSGLPVLSEKLRNITKAKHILITLGSEGVYINSEHNNQIIEDNLQALNLQPENISGAGDSFLVGVSIFYTLTKNIWASVAFGSIMAALKVAKDGNTPVNLSEINNLITKL